MGHYKMRKLARNTFLFLVIAVMGKFSIAQKSEVEVVADPRIDSLVRSQAKSDHMMVPGFRIQITTERSKKEIDKVRTEFILTYPNVPTYVFFLSPNYILKAGDFQFKEDALEFFNNLTTYPYSFLTEELVNSN